MSTLMSKSEKTANSEIEALSQPTTLRREYGVLCRLGAPVLVTQLGIIVVSFADTMMVGAYGLNELSASAFVNSLFMIATVMLIGFASGITPLVGALFGRGKHREAGATMRSGLQMNILIATVATIVMGVIYFMLHLFGQDSDLMLLVRPYYLIILSTLLPMSVFNCLQQVSNGITDTATPMWIMVSCNVMNIIGNYMLIFGKWGAPELGLIGAGISTMIARYTAALTILCVFIFSKRRRSYRKGMAIRIGRRQRRMLVWVTSYPVMIQSGVECGLWSVGAIVCGWFGKVQLAAYQVVNTIAQLGFMIYMSIGVATSVRIANYMGQRSYENVVTSSRAGLHLNLCLATFSSLVFLTLGRWLIHAFTPEEAVIANAVTLIFPLILYQYGDAVQLTYANALRGTSHVKPLLVVSIISYILVGIPSLLLFAKTLQLKNVGVYYSFSVALITAGLLLWKSFYSTIKKLRRQS